MPGIANTVSPGSVEVKVPLKAMGLRPELETRHFERSNLVTTLPWVSPRAVGKVTDSTSVAEGEPHVTQIIRKT